MWNGIAGRNLLTDSGNSIGRDWRPYPSSSTRPLTPVAKSGTRQFEDGDLSWLFPLRPAANQCALACLFRNFLFFVTPPCSKEPPLWVVILIRPTAPPSLLRHVCNSFDLVFDAPFQGFCGSMYGPIHNVFAVGVVYVNPGNTIYNLEEFIDHPGIDGKSSGRGAAITTLTRAPMLNKRCPPIEHAERKCSRYQVKRV